ncbi:MPIP2-like protein [Mya arenaria]|uniref:MPIP2-like protein n=1 Tax=Mya arenaria TaxID=6604 RepID=A0ABY7FGS6_MYAAR|nr:MPIP2-like protein [Mya arenaria]
MPVPRMMLSPDDVMTGNHSTPHGNDMIESATLNMSIDTIDGSESGTSETSSTSDFHTSGSSDGSSGKSAQEKRATFFIEESCSQDSGLGFERADSTDSCKDSNDGFTFAAPMGLPLRLQAKMISEDTCSPFKYSPVKLSPAHRRNSCPVSSLDFSGEFTKSSSSEGGEDSPLKICRLTSVDEGHGGDDGFLDVMDAEVAALTNGSGLSSAMSSLFNAPVLNKRSVTTTQEDDDTPVTRRSMCRRNIARSMSMDVRPQRISFKRENPDCGDSPMQISFKRPQDESTPIQQQKRHRPASVIESPMQARVRPSLHRCHSETEAMIKSALARQADEPDLVGDCSRSYALPTHHCEPQTYKPMLHKDHAEDLRKFRSKSKSWAGEQRASRSGFRPLKF